MQELGEGGQDVLLGHGGGVFLKRLELMIPRSVHDEAINKLSNHWTRSGALQAFRIALVVSFPHTGRVLRCLRVSGGKGACLERGALRCLHGEAWPLRFFKAQHLSIVQTRGILFQAFIKQRHRHLPAPLPNNAFRLLCIPAALPSSTPVPIPESRHPLPKASSSSKSSSSSASAAVVCNG